MNINNICGVTSCRHCFDGNCNRSYWDECEFRIAFENQIKNKWIPCSERLPEEHEEPKDIYDPFTLAIEDTQYFSRNKNDDDTGVVKPKFLNVIFVDEDGEIACVRDETFMFKFVRR